MRVLAPALVIAGAMMAVYGMSIQSILRVVVGMGSVVAGIILVEENELR